MSGRSAIAGLMIFAVTTVAVTTVAVVTIFLATFAKAADTESERPLTQNEVYSYVYGATTAILVHEVGHALIDIFQLPTVAEEEDDADEFASMFIISQALANPKSHVLADNMADFFYSYVEQAQRAEGGAVHNFVYWDKHNLAERRAFNILCDMYGAFPDRYRSRLRDIGATRKRLKRCEIDISRNLNSWLRLLKGRFRGEDEKAVLRGLTALGLDAAFQDKPRFRVTYTPSLSADESGWFQGNESLRYHLLTYIANLLSTEFKLTPIEVDDTLAVGESRIGSIDIYSRHCGYPGAFYNQKTRAITVCHELHTEMADAYIRYRTGEDPRIWWAARWLEEYSADEKKLVGVWKAEDGSRLVLQAGSLTSGGVFMIRGNGASGFAPRHGRWGINGATLWLIETFREGVKCFNPACRPTVSADGLTAREQTNLRYGLAPHGEIRGLYSVPPCGPVSSRPKPSVATKEQGPAVTDFSTKVKADCNSPLSDAEYRAFMKNRAKIEIDGAVFHYVGPVPTVVSFADPDRTADPGIPLFEGAGRK